jgi:hypothetical protein
VEDNFKRAASARHRAAAELFQGRPGHFHIHVEKRGISLRGVPTLRLSGKSRTHQAR